jgi:hypothetical protein
MAQLYEKSAESVTTDAKTKQRLTGNVGETSAVAVAACTVVAAAVAAATAVVAAETEV